jgi:predicted dehydrogenase
MIKVWVLALLGLPLAGTANPAVLPASVGQAREARPHQAADPSDKLSPPGSGATVTAPASAHLNIGMIGLDTSHVIRFAKLLNSPGDPGNIPGVRIAFAFKGGSPDMELSRSRVDAFEKEIRTTYGVTVLGSIDEVVARSDAIMIESVDGRVHLEQARAVFKGGKPVFIDKPLGGSLRDVLAIAELARKSNVPIFSSSGLRFSAGVRKLKEAKLGRLRGAIAYGPAHSEPHHPDLFWYGIHAVEALYTLMGTGCQTVVRSHTEDTDVVTGTWQNGTTGVVYGLRNGAVAHRIIAFGAKAIAEENSSGDDTLLREIVAFFRTGKPPVSIEETIELFTFMEAADESKRRGGQPVTLLDVRNANAR